MALTPNPFSPWELAVTLLAAMAALLLLGRGAIDRWRSLGRRGRTRAAILALSLLAAGLLAAAAWNVEARRPRAAERGHLVVVADVSDSVLRAPGGWEAVRAGAAALVRPGLEAMPEESRQQAGASIVTFRSGTSLVDLPSLEDLPAAIEALDRSGFAAGAGSNIGAGLERAGDRIDRAGGQGAVLLISDGNQTEGDALAAARRLAHRGIPVSVYPVESAGPELAIAAANLARKIAAGAVTYLRGVLSNGSGQAVTAEVSLAMNAGLEGVERPPGIADRSSASVTLDAGEWTRFRQSLRFEGSGLQFVDLTLAPSGGQGEHRRRFFIQVDRPPAILAIGGDFNWTAAFPPGTAEIRQVDPAAFSANPDTGEADLVVIANVPATSFTESALQALARAVEAEGIGLMLVNGGHRGVSEEEPTVLMSYIDTPIEPLLPVSSEPRPHEPEPPARQVVILIDASGSMAGGPIEKSKQVARYIVETFLREQDTLDVIAFTDKAIHVVDAMPMHAEGKAEAVRRINGIVANGGTDPTRALALIAERQMSDCGLIFISDGEFETVAYRPDCRATVFAIGHESVPAGSPLRELADPFPVGAAFNPANISIPYFEPEPRNKYFEPGDFAPLSMQQLRRMGDPVSVPSLPMPGNAVSYIKEEAELIAVRPKLRDPILAYREAGAGYVGVLTTEVPAAWLEAEEGRAAVRDWVTRVAPFAARDRYDFRLVDQGETLEVEIAIAGQDGVLPEIDQLTAVVELADGETIGIPLGLDPEIPATFRGAVRLARSESAEPATLVLRETGPDALARPQRLPLLIPPEGQVEGTLPGEAASYGLNRALLEAIAGAGGGSYAPREPVPLLRPGGGQPRTAPLWPVLVVAAVLGYLAAIALQRFER